MTKAEGYKWEPTCNRFIVFMDIMGFQDTVYRSSHNEVKRIMEQLKNPIQAIDKEFQEKLKGKGVTIGKTADQVVKPVIFSDSILLFSYDESPESFRKTLWAVQFIIGDAIRHGIPIKGAIAYGRQTADIDNSLYFGKPLIAAFELQKDLYMYGVVLHHTVDNYMQKKKKGCKSIIDSHEIRRYDAPFKQGSISHYVVDWPDYFIVFKKYKNGLPRALLDLYCKVSGSARKYVDNTKTT